MAGGGFGSEFFGDPMGGGGDLHVLGARAVTSQTVRVALSAEPRHFSPASVTDALNPSNYVFSVDSGIATAPLPVGAGNVQSGPLLGIPDAAWGVDVQVDRALVQGIVYRVTLRNAQGRAGEPLGSPVSAPFSGVSKLTIKRQLPRKVDLTDVANSPFGGTYSVDDSGDLGIEGGLQGLRKRALRRASTPKNGFSHLPGYGTFLKLKKNFTQPQVNELRNDLRIQLLQEPEVADAAVSVTQLTTGAIQVVMKMRTKTGAIVEASTTQTPGGITVP